VPRLLHENFASFREEYSPLHSVEEGSANDGFESTYLHGQRWLSDMEALRSSSEVKFLGNREEVTKVPQFKFHTQKVSLS